MHSYLLVATLVTLAGMDPVPARGGPNFLARARGGGKILFSERGRGEREREKTSGDSSDTRRQTDRQTDIYR